MGAVGVGGERLSHEKKPRRKPDLRGWFLVAAIVGIIVVAGVVAEPISDGWRRPDADFYVTCATIAPLFGLALFVEIALVMTPVIADQGLSSVNVAMVRTLVRLNAAMLVLSESSALYAVGGHRRTAFLVVLSTAPWLVQLVLLIDTAYNRIGINWIGRGRG